MTIPSKIIGLLLLVFFAFSACKEEKATPSKDAKEMTMAADLAKVPDSWIDKRVAKAKTRLGQSEAGKIVWNAMEAHGGLGQWYKNGPVSFQFYYKPLDGGTPRNTHQIVETWSSRARHKKVNDSISQYGWDGKNAWVQAKDSTVFPYNTRFWSLTPYFFMAQPFVLDGQGTNLELLPQENYKDTTYDVIRVTFDAGTGDAPDDYYVLYFNAENHQLGVIRYVVSYPKYFKKGEHTPEKFMELYGQQTVNGIVLPERYQTHWLVSNNQPGEYITDIRLSNVSFVPELEDHYFTVPEGAEVLEGL
ncbi:hypothetical protein [Spongiimicrobium salis]|uniref:hypothetical protein n=1 Tax=Spongiimicrobium salis TaxID=1667022 RepID=UPI00374CAB8C